MSKEPSPVRSTRCARGAFTSVDLLVVIVVVGVLGAFTAAQVSSAKALSRRNQCAGNLRRLSWMLQVFVSDQGHYPLVVNPQGGSGPYSAHKASWFASLEGDATDPTGKATKCLNKGVWDCPSANQPDTFKDGEGYSEYGYNGYGLGTTTNGFSLGLGGHIDTQSKEKGSTRPVAEADVLEPSDMIALGDGFTGDKGVIQDGVSAFHRKAGTEDYQGSTARSRSRHYRFANVVFCDGHVVAIPLTILFDSKEPQYLQFWNSDNKPHAEFLSP